MFAFLIISTFSSGKGSKGNDHEVMYIQGKEFKGSAPFRFGSSDSDDSSTADNDREDYDRYPEGDAGYPEDEFDPHFHDHPGDHRRRRYKKPNCTYPNTKPGYGRECICNDSYIGDNPVQPRGCWKCENKCHSSASCIYPGNCSCNGGLLGDGVNECKERQVKPLGIRVTKSTNLSYPQAIIEIEEIPNYVPYKVYCNFSGTIVAARIGSKEIKCYIPNGQVNSVSISVDKGNWSETLQFNPESRNENYFKPEKEVILPKPVKEVKEFDISESYYIFAQLISLISFIGLLLTIFLPKNALTFGKKAKLYE